ncbi:MAG: hypothetical protein D3917_06450 [Candidatus Electrothrix sp. AX5]|nr:hypothetical protein [Candidatus Electrothrix sp. AX5]
MCGLKLSFYPVGQAELIEIFFLVCNKEKYHLLVRRDTWNGSEEDIVFYLLYSFLYCYFF